MSDSVEWIVWLWEDSRAGKMMICRIDSCSFSALPDEILLTVTSEAGFPDIIVSKGNQSFRFTLPTWWVSIQPTLLRQEGSITSVLYGTDVGLTKYRTIKKTWSGWSTAQWFNSCYVESQHLKSIKEWLIIFKPWIPLLRKKKKVY